MGEGQKRTAWQPSSHASSSRAHGTEIEKYEYVSMEKVIVFWSQSLYPPDYTHMLFVDLNDNFSCQERSNMLFMFDHLLCNCSVKGCRENIIAGFEIVPYSLTHYSLYSVYDIVHYIEYEQTRIRTLRWTFLNVICVSKWPGIRVKQTNAPTSSKQTGPSRGKLKLVLMLNVTFPWSRFFFLN